MAWQIIYHDERLQQAILGLPQGIMARYFHCTDRMEEHGPDLGMPHTRALRNGLFELWLKSKEGIGRVFWSADRSAHFDVASICEENRQNTTQRN